MKLFVFIHAVKCPPNLNKKRRNYYPKIIISPLYNININLCYLYESYNFSIITSMIKKCNCKCESRIEETQEKYICNLNTKNLTCIYYLIIDILRKRSYYIVVFTSVNKNEWVNFTFYNRNKMEKTEWLNFTTLPHVLAVEKQKFG